MLCHHSMRGSICQTPLCIAYYRDTQWSRTRAEPVCRINWIRRHDTFPSCHLRRKLHDPFSYVAGDAAGYAWRRSEKTAPGHAERGTPGAGKDIRRKISFACDAIMYEHYVILYYNTGPNCQGPSSLYAPPLRYKREALAVQNRPTRTLTYTGSPRHSQTLSRQGNTTHSGRRVLRSGGPNHSKSLVFIVFLSEIELGLANPRVHTLWA